MGETSIKKLYRGIIIALIAAVVPLFLLGSVQIITGMKISKDNAIAIHKIQDNYMRIDLFERWVVLLEERSELNNKACVELRTNYKKLDKEINELYKKIQKNVYGISRSKDTTQITYNGDLL